MSAARRRIRAILRKEWIELRKNKTVLWTMLALPVLLVISIIGGAAAFDPTKPVKGFTVIAGLEHLTPGEAMIVLINDQFAFYLLMTPMILPGVIAGHSIFGEKAARSLEPLLASPVRTWELLLAKSLTAVIPATVIGWLSYGASAIGIAMLTNANITACFVRPTWIVGMLLLSPLLALCSTMLAVIASSRAKDARTAQGAASIGVFPLIGFATYVLIGKVYLTMGLILLTTAVVVALDLLVLWLAVRLFQREAILTRWK